MADFFAVAAGSASLVALVRPIFPNMAILPRRLVRFGSSDRVMGMAILLIEAFPAAPIRDCVMVRAGIVSSAVAATFVGW